MTSTARPDEAIDFFRVRDLPMWHVRRPDSVARALWPDAQGAGFLRSMLTETPEAYRALLHWLPARHYGHDWPTATPACSFPWAVVQAPLGAEPRGPLPDFGIRLGGHVWWLHPVRHASHSEAMERAHIIAATIPLATAWDPLAGVPLPGTGGAVIVGRAGAG